MFCGKHANTKEHIVPKWLHKQFDLQHQKLQIRNKTELKYLNVVLPACKDCNGRFSQVENRIQQEHANEQDYYVWALKVYSGLNSKDAKILEDRKDRSKGTVLTEAESIKGIEFAQQILKSYGRPHFSTFPTPFGSVFINAVPKNLEKSFALCSVGFPYNVITITLNENKLLTVILNDFGLVKNAIKSNLVPSQLAFDELLKLIQSNNEITTTNDYAKLLTIDYARNKSRLSLPKSIFSYSNRVSARIPKKTKLSKNYDGILVLSDLCKKLAI